MRRLFFVLLTAATVLGVHALTVQNTAGNLANLVSNTQITQLTVTGEMNARDFLFITEELTELTAVDLSQASIVAVDGSAVIYGTVTSYPADEIPRTAFFGKKLTSVALPAGLKSIGYAAFAGCYQLRSVTLPATVTYIDDYAFAGSALTSIELPSNVTGMGKGVFSRCEALVQATVNTVYVGDFSFLGDFNLSTMNLGSQVQYIGRGVFNGCTALQTLNIDPACRISRIDEEAFINSGLESIDITALGVGTIGDWAFAQTQLSSFTLPDGMTDLGVGSMAHNPLLETVLFPGMGHAADPAGRGDGLDGGSLRAPSHKRTLTEVKDFTFAGNSQLHAGEILREGVTRVGDFAFYNVSQEIDTMRLPSTIAYLGKRAMAGMTGMKVLKTGATEVPELGEEVWAGVDQPSVLLLPPDAESTELYKVADQWMYFFFKAPEDDYIVGDVNNDGVVNVSDVTALIGFVLGNDVVINEQAADMSGDGILNVADVTQLISYILNGGSRMSLSNLRDAAIRNSMTTTDALELPAVSMRAGQTRTVEVALNNNEHYYTAMQLMVVLPEGLTLTGVEGVDRGSQHQYSMLRHETEENVYILMGVSFDLAPFAGNEGNVMRLTLTAGEDFIAQDAELLLANILLATPDQETYLAANAKARVNDPSGIEQVTADRQVAAVRYINVAGQESETPFDGVNIVVTTYTDGTTSTVKVIK